MNKLDAAILKTLAYADLFNQSLRREELIKYCIDHTINHPQEIDKITHPLIIKKHNCFALSNREELINLKASQEAVTLAKRSYAQQWLWIFALIPWVQLVAITGSVAGGTPRKDDDIDLLIITQPHRLWLTRLLLNLVLNIFGKRRKPNDKPNQVNNQFCLNMWLSQDNLTETAHDLYTANELARIIPLLNRHQTYQKYLAANSWMQPILPNFNNQLAQNSPIANQSFFLLPLLHPIDQLAQKLQRQIMKQPTRETVADNRLAFHPRDYRSEILKRYRQRLQQLSIPK